MADFSFLHMADLHLGSPFRGLSVSEPAVARRFSQAIRDTFCALVARAIREEVDFVVIAGDVYDGEWRDASVGLFLNRELARLAEAGVPVYLVKGNHDAASVVTRSVTLPKGVHTFGVGKPSTLALPHLKVALHGQSYREREAPDNLARDYPEARAGHFNIGVLHTSLSGYEGHAPYAPCSQGDLVAKGYDYWALGHIHAPQVVRGSAPAIVYPGCIQGRSVRETGPRGAMHVRVAGGEVSLEPWVADQARWCVAEVDASRVADFHAEVPPLVEAAVREAVADAGDRLVALRVRLAGATAAHDWMAAHAADVRMEVEAAAQRVSPDVWLEKVRLATTSDAPPLAPDLGEFDLAGLLREAAADERFAAQVEGDLATLLAKLPTEGRDGFDGDHETLLADAQALLATRIGRAQ